MFFIVCVVLGLVVMSVMGGHTECNFDFQCGGFFSDPQRGACDVEFFGGSCICRDGWMGFRCEDVMECNGVVHTDPSGCSNNGNCTDSPGNGPGHCHCEATWGGPHCDVPGSCFGVAPDNVAVCSTHGECITSVCECEEDYSGDECEVWTCDGILNTHPTVCSSRGNCEAQDECFGGNAPRTDEIPASTNAFIVFVSAAVVCVGSCVAIGVLLIFIASRRRRSGRSNGHGYRKQG